MTRLLTLATMLMASGHLPAGDFRTDVLPVLSGHCFACHSTKGKTKGGLALDTPEGLKKGGESGPVVVPGKPDASRLIQAVRYTHDDLKMPPKGKLPAAAITAIEDWVRAGAEDDRPAARVETWWSFQPLKAPVVPGDAIHPIDAFVRAKLKEKGLKPAPPADPRTLIRRLTLDLTGLPPTPEEVESFERAATENRKSAIENAIDRLLASPRYGERWARHWLDVVHYGDTHGYDKDKPRPNAWPYRDYVIRSFNTAKPFGRFVAEQLAGDVTYPGTVDGIEALGFIAAGPWDLIGHEELPESKIDGKLARHLDRDDMVANTVSTFMSLTAHCAQCHDHKFDPIPQEDYYALQAVFAALDRADRPYYRDAKLQQLAHEVAEIRRQLSQRRDQLDQTVRTKAGASLVRLEGRMKQVEAGIQAFRRPQFGYHSALDKTPDQTKWVQLDLGRAVDVARIELYGCHDDFNNIGPGFGFPVRFKVEVCDDADFRTNVRVVADHTAEDAKNPGIDSWPIMANERARYLRVTATKLAFRKDVYIFALDEIRVLDDQGDNHARRAAVTSKDAIESLPRWSQANVVDGTAFGRDSERARRRLRELTTQRSAVLRAATDADTQSRLDAIDDMWRRSGDAMVQLPPPADRVYAGTVHAGEGNFRGTGGNNGRARTIHLLKRGDVKTPLHEVRPGVIAALAIGPPRFELPPDHHEAARRVALAQWITHQDNPLTWRSIVNRVWQYHFGRGLCATSGDFGRMGELPTHPELLDYLAASFRDGNQSLKALHRLICTSETYQQASIWDPAAAEIDADNRWLWRANRRRLDAEEVHDALLFVAGRLDLTMGGPGFQNFVVEKPEHSPHYLYDKHAPEDARCHRRSIYRFIVRSKAQPFMAALDCADPSLRVDKRNETQTPQQALALWNDKLAVAMAAYFADRCGREASSDDARATRTLQLALGRPPSDAERQAIVAHAKAHGWPSACRVVFNLNEFLFVD